MITSQVEALLACMGQRNEQIRIDGLQNDSPLVAMFEGDELLFKTVEPGVAMSFHTSSKIFHTLNFLLLKASPEEGVYTGPLPSPFKLIMHQSDMRNLLGEPMKSSGPIKMPQPLGQTGGWDLFSLDQEKFPGLKAMLQYTATLEVFGLVFMLMDEEV